MDEFAVGGLTLIAEPQGEKVAWPLMWLHKVLGEALKRESSSLWTPPELEMGSSIGFCYIFIWSSKRLLCVCVCVCVCVCKHAHRHACQLIISVVLFDSYCSYKSPKGFVNIFLNALISLLTAFPKSHRFIQHYIGDFPGGSMVRNLPASELDPRVRKIPCRRE